MKKLLILLPLVLLLALSACTPSPGSGESNPDTQATTTPVTQPSTQPAETTDPALVQPPFSELEVFIHGQYDQSFDMYLTACKKGHLYYYHHETKTVSAICDEPVICYTNDNINFYFVKEAEPTKLYCAPQTDLNQQKVIYESDFGTINDVYPETLGTYADRVVTLTEGNKRGILLDLTTGEVTVVLEQYYIEKITIEGLKEENGKPAYSKIWFHGKLNEGENLQDYFFWAESGTITKNES